MKKSIIKKEFILDGNQFAIIMNFLHGNWSSRETAKELHMSHQGAINLTLSIVKSWIQTGKMIYKDDSKNPSK